MNYIYTNTRDNKRYILQPEISMGEKVCLIDMASCEHKFVSPKTLKRWYNKTVADDMVVELRAFTGMRIGLFCANHTLTTNSIQIWTKSNKQLTFDAETGKQTNAKNPKYANKIGFTYDFPEMSLNWALN